MGSKVGRIVAGVILTAGSVVALAFGQPQLAYALGSIGLGMLYNEAFGARGLNDRQATVMENRTDVREHIPLIYGETRVGANMIDIRVDDASPDNKRLALVAAFCLGSSDGGDIEGVQTIYLDDKIAWTKGAGLAGVYNGFLPVSDTIQSKFLKVTVHEGATSQTVDADLTALFPTEHPSTSRGRSVCYVTLLAWADSDVYPNGIPRINALIRGQRCFDPRTSTTIYTQNPAVIIRDYLVSTVYGFGVPTADIIEQTFIDMANYCDEIVSLPSAGSQKRFVANGWVDTSKSLSSNLADLATSCRAQVFETGGKWQIHIRRTLAVSGLKLDKGNTVEGSWNFFLPGSRDVPNVMRATYLDPARDYRPDTVQWPDPGAANPALTNDNDFESRFAIDLPYTDNRLRAQQFCLTLTKEMREGIMVTLTAKGELLQGKIGDIVELTYLTPGWVDKPFWIIAMNIKSDFNIDMVLVEYESTVYDLDAQVDQPAIPNTNLPDPHAAPPPTSLVLTADASVAQETNAGVYIPRIRATWVDADHNFVAQYDLEAKPSSVSELWDSFGPVPVGEEYFLVYPVDEQSWDVRIRTVTKSGVKSDWVEETVSVDLGPHAQIGALGTTVKRTDGSAVVRAELDPAVKSVRYVAIVGVAPSWPNDAAVEAGTIITPTATFVDIAFGAGTVLPGERLLIRMVPYAAINGIGPDGSAATHGSIVADLDGTDQPEVRSIAFRVSALGVVDLIIRTMQAKSIKWAVSNSSFPTPVTNANTDSEGVVELLGVDTLITGETLFVAVLAYEAINQGGVVGTVEGRDKYLYALEPTVESVGTTVHTADGSATVRMELSPLVLSIRYATAVGANP
ncbi:hypothetical protein LCGC14_0691660, partial [marine sediment metagenome]